MTTLIFIIFMWLSVATVALIIIAGLLIDQIKRNEAMTEEGLEKVSILLSSALSERSQK